MDLLIRLCKLISTQWGGCAGAISKINALIVGAELPDGVWSCFPSNPAHQYEITPNVVNTISAAISNTMTCGADVCGAH